MLTVNRAFDLDQMLSNSASDFDQSCLTLGHYFLKFKVNRMKFKTKPDDQLWQTI